MPDQLDFLQYLKGLLGLKCQIIDNLDKVGGQCAELYPDKPIFDIPGVPSQTAEEHIEALLEQIKPFDYGLHLNNRVDEIHQIDSKEEIQKWKVITSKQNEFIATNVFIAAGGGSFEPRRPPNIIDPDRFIDKGVAYSVKDKNYYKNKNLVIFGGGDSALDWSVELSDLANSITLVHRRDAFRGALNTESQMRELVETGNIEVLSRESENSLYDEDIVTFEDDEKLYDQSDATGFIKINALRLKLNSRRNKK